MSFVATDPNSVSGVRERADATEPADDAREILVRGLIFFAVLFGVLGAVALGAR